jgi:hypothetical protein
MMMFNAAEGIRGSAFEMILEIKSEKCDAERSVVARSGAEHEPLQLADRAAAQS